MPRFYPRLVEPISVASGVNGYVLSGPLLRTVRPFHAWFGYAVSGPLVCLSVANGVDGYVLSGPFLSIW